MAKNPWWAPWALDRLIEPMMRELTTQVPGIAMMKAGDRALDVCCGTGGLAFVYARRGVITVGIDVDHRVIKVAERKRSELHLPHVSFQTASALNLPFDDHCFDHVSIAMSIHEVSRSHRDTIVSEMKRVVRSQGTLIFLDYMAPMPQVPHAWAARLVELVSGRDHNRCFNDYLKQGGLMALLERNRLKGEKKSELCPMEIVLAKTADVNR